MKLDVKKINNTIDVLTYLIDFEYETRKHNRKTQQRLVKVINGEDPKDYFKEWVGKSRTIFNAKILNVVELTEYRQVVVL